MGEEAKGIPPRPKEAAMQTQARPTLDDLVKASMASGISRAKIAEEAKKQEKSDEDKEKEEKDSCMGSKAASVSTDEALKIASAMDYVAQMFKQASDGMSELGGGGGGPTSLPVSMATASTPISEDTGKATAKNQPPMRPGMEAAMPGAASNSMQTNANIAPGGNAKMPDKVAMYAANLQRLGLGKEAASVSRFRPIATRSAVGNSLAGGLAGMPTSIGDLNRMASGVNAAHAAKFTPSAAGLQQGSALQRAQQAFGGKADTNQLIAGLTPAAKAAPAATQAAAPAAAAGGGFFGGLKDRLSGMFGGGAPALQPKMASLYQANLNRLGMKLANEGGLGGAAPAGNSGNSLHTSASGESGGSPVGGMPQGPTGLISSNQSAIDYTKGQAYANRKQDMKAYLSEPMMSAANDTVLRNAFDHTSEAGPKIASAQELLARLYEEVAL